MTRHDGWAALLSVLALGLGVQASEGAEPGKPEVTWPGMTRAGAVLLPNGWSLKPAGRQTRLGDFPVLMAEHPSEPILAVLHAGYGEHEVITLDAGDRQGDRPGRRSPRPSPGSPGRPTASGSSSAAGSTT